MYFGELSFILTLRTRSRHVNIKAFDHNVSLFRRGCCIWFCSIVQTTLASALQNYYNLSLTIIKSRRNIIYCFFFCYIRLQSVGFLWCKISRKKQLTYMSFVNRETTLLIVTFNSWSLGERFCLCLAINYCSLTVYGGWN